MLARRNILASELLGLKPQYANFHAWDPALCHLNFVGSQFLISQAGITLLICCVHIQD